MGKEKFINIQIILWGLLFGLAILRFEETIGFGLNIPWIAKITLLVALGIGLFFIRRSMLRGNSAENQKKDVVESKKGIIVSLMLLSAVIAFFIVRAIMSV